MRRSGLIQFVCFAACALAATAASAQNQTNAEVAGWIKKLTSKTEGPAAADALAVLKDAAAVPALIQAVGAEYPVEVRWRAERALGAIGPDAQSALDALVENLGDPDERVRAYGCYAVGRIAAQPTETLLRALVKCATDPNVVVRRAAVDAVQQLKPDRKVVAPLMLTALRDADPRVAVDAIHTLVEQGAVVAPSLIEALNDEKARYWAAVALEAMGPDAAEAVQPLGGLLSEAEPELRMQALMTLAAIGEPSLAVAPDIVKRLETDEFTGVRYAAAYALGKIGAARQGRVALMKAMESDDAMLAMMSAWALTKGYPEDRQIAQKAATLIASALQSEDFRVQAAAARALAESNLPSELTAPALEKVLATASPQVVAQAIDAFAAQGRQAVPRVLRGLKNEKLRKYAIQVLGRMGPEAAEATPALIEAAQSADPETQSEIHYALAAIGPDASSAVPVLVESLSAKESEVVFSALYALGRMGPKGRAALPQLEGLLSNDDELVSTGAAWAMCHIAPANAKVASVTVPVLLRALRSDRSLVRIEAAAALGELGAAAKATLPALEAALKDPNPDVRDAARAAIERIGKS